MDRRSEYRRAFYESQLHLGENELCHIRIDRQSRVALCGIMPRRVFYLHNLDRMWCRSKMTEDNICNAK